MLDIRLISRWILVSCVLLFSINAVAEVVPWEEGGPSLGKDLDVGVVTFSVGDEIPSWFGHTAILIRDKRLRQQRIYNYGMFSFGADMLPKFLMGRLEFWVADASVRGTFAAYKRMDRDIRVQYLNLSPEKRLEAARFMAWNVRIENRNYMYDHYDDNCSTRPRDVVDKVVGGQFRKFASTPARFTLRQHTRRHAQHNPYIDFLLTAWMNKEIDQPLEVWDEMFLPGELEDALDKFQYVDAAGKKQPVVKRKVIVHKTNRTKIPDEPNLFSLRTFIAGFLIGLLGFVLFRRRLDNHESKANRVWLGLYLFLLGFLIGVPAMAVLLFNFTEHTITFWNENLFIMNPLTSTAGVFGVMIAFGSTRALNWSLWSWRVLAFLTIIYVAMKPLPFFEQDNWAVIAFFVPLNLILGLGPFLSDVYRERKKPGQ